MPLSARQATFVAEFLANGGIASRAARAAGYSAKTEKQLAVAATRLLGNVGVRSAIEEGTRERNERLRLDADTVLLELAKLVRADPGDYIPEDGQALDIRQLPPEQRAAIREFEIIDVVDRRTGEVSRRTKVKLHDKNAALTTLAKCMGMLTERHVLEGTIEHLIRQMTPQERAERVRQLREKGRALLPVYREQQAAAGRTLDAESEDGAATDEIEGEAVADDPGRDDGASASPIETRPEETVEAVRQRAGSGLGGEIDDPPERAAWGQDRRR